MCTPFYWKRCIPIINNSCYIDFSLTSFYVNINKIKPIQNLLSTLASDKIIEIYRQSNLMKLFLNVRLRQTCFTFYFKWILCSPLPKHGWIMLTYGFLHYKANVWFLLVKWTDTSITLIVALHLYICTNTHIMFICVCQCVYVFVYTHTRIYVSINEVYNFVCN